MSNDTATLIKIPRRPQTAKRYLEIIKFACGKRWDSSSVAKHFGVSPATVVNASKAFGVSYDEVKRKKRIPHVEWVERQLAANRGSEERNARILELYQSPTHPTLEEIGRQFGLTRQRVHQIVTKAIQQGLPVGKRLPQSGHWIGRCRICAGMQALARQKPLMTTRAIALAINIPLWKVYWHLEKLREQRLIPRYFGCFRSERIVQAVELYNQDRTISAWKLGRMLGYKNLPALFRELHRRGLGDLLSPRVKVGRRPTLKGSFDPGLYQSRPCIQNNSQRKTA